MGSFLDPVFILLGMYSGLITAFIWSKLGSIMTLIWTNYGPNKGVILTPFLDHLLPFLGTHSGLIWALFLDQIRVII